MDLADARARVAAAYARATAVAAQAGNTGAESTLQLLTKRLNDTPAAQLEAELKEHGSVHAWLERLANHQGVVGQVLDSMTATVVGLVAITGLQLMRSAITRPLDAIIFGALLIAVAIWMITPVLPTWAAMVQMCVADGRRRKRRNISSARSCR